jgi:hypothetical protein
VAIGATRQAQFFARDDGVIVEIVVFPSTHLEPESVEGSYGRPARKAFTDDLRPVWYYPALGVTVFALQGHGTRPSACITDRQQLQPAAVASRHAETAIIARRRVPRLSHIVIIVMENRECGQVIGRPPISLYCLG